MSGRWAVLLGLGAMLAGGVPAGAADHHARYVTILPAYLCLLPLPLLDLHAPA